VLSVKSLHTDYAAAGGAVVNAVQDVSFDVPDGELFTLLGPSGCGKTTTLRSIAGLERPRSGSIALDGRVVYSSDAGIFVAPNRRNFGMVFQSYAIWPHMNVFKNVAFPLEVRKVRPSRKEIEQKVMRVLATVQLAELVDRDATKLSGGQQQRLALARALVMEPQLLLLDEPLSNLDAKLREAMRFELKRMQRDLGLTTIYVTHDQSEALALSHEIAVMSEGRIVQIALLGGGKATISVGKLMVKRLHHTGSTLRPRSNADKAAMVAAIEAKVMPLFRDGRVKPLMDSSFPLEKAADAHRRMETSEHIGKIVLAL